MLNLNLTWALYSRDRWGLTRQCPGPVWWSGRQRWQGNLPGQGPVSDHQTILCSADQKVASHDTLIQRLLRPGNLPISRCNSVSNHCRWVGHVSQSSCYIKCGCLSLISRVYLGLDPYLFVLHFLSGLKNAFRSLSVTDCAASQFCFPGPDVHSDCSTFWRVSKSDSQSMDVWETVHVLQVGITDTRTPHIL